MADTTQVEEVIFQAALAIGDPQQRHALLDAACRDDADLRQRIASLLAAGEKAGQFMRQPAAVFACTANENISEGPGTKIGRYKLLEQIGEGGFGVVYMAEQQEPVVRRVALKIIKLGMDTKQVIARFEAERQALALMAHPNIAKILDAGTTETGRPYFVMELVRGIPVTEYCDDRGLTTDQRLDIFIQICAAVQHAHQKGIIHRDIKPSNVLASTNGDRAVPMIIDFGIAKATQGRLTEKTLFTQFRQFIGTPAYMSPEQAQMSALDVDTRSDIYSLGVLLYELMTGKTPLDSTELRKAGYEEVCRRIREEEAIAPSQRISSLQEEELKTVAKSRRVAPADFHALIRGDLDWIVMKAVEKDRSRRYSTADAMAKDIERHLNREPVTPVPPNTTYLLGKFIRRNQGLLATVGIIAATLLMATAVSAWLAVTATRMSHQLAQEVFEKGHAVERAEVAESDALTAQHAAVAEKLRTREVAYASDIHSAYQALRLNNLGLAKRIVNRNREFPDGPDLRNWEWRALWLQCRGDEISTFGDRRDSITSIQYSPDGKWLAVGEAEEGIRVWDIATGKLSHTLVQKVPKQFGFVAFTPAGDRLYATAADGVVKAWNVPTFNAADIRLRHGGRIRDIEISPNGELLAAFGFDKEITLWRLDDHTQLARLYAGPGGGDMHGELAISPDSTQLALGLGSKIRILDLKTHEERLTIEQSGSTALAFSRDGQILASGTSLTDPTVYLHRVSDGKLMGRLERHTLYIFDVEFSPDGKLLASASADQTIRLWDTETWTEKAVLRGHENEVWTLNFSEHGEHLISGGKNGEICVWDPNERGPRWPIRVRQAVPYDDWHRQYSQASFSPDGRSVATRNRDHSVSLRSATNLAVTRPLPGLGNNVREARFSPAENLIAAGDFDGSLAILTLDVPRDVARLEIVPGAQVFPAGFSEDGKRLLAVARQESQSFCFVVSVGNRSVQQSWLLPSEDECAAISPDGSLVVTGHGDGRVRIWSVANPEDPYTVRIGRQVLGVAFSPDGAFVVAGNANGQAEIFDVAARKRIGRLAGHMQGIHAVGFSTDGKRVVTGGSTGESVKIWDFATRRELMTLAVDGFSFRQVEFSPDGSAILAMGGGGDVSLWRVPSLQEIQFAETKQKVRSD